MSSRKMSESGGRPASTTSLSSTDFEPAFGPRLTQSRPAPSGMSGRTTDCSSDGSPASIGVNVIVVGSSAEWPRTWPQDEQKFDPGGLRCPQLLQKTSATRATVHGNPQPHVKPSVGDQRLVRGGVE